MILISEGKLVAINAAIFFVVFLTVRIYIGSVYDLSPICEDGWVSQSIGNQGACSSHGGVDYSRGFFALVIGAASGLVTMFLVSKFKLFRVEKALNVNSSICTSESTEPVYTTAITSLSAQIEPPADAIATIDSQVIPASIVHQRYEDPTQLEMFGGRKSWTPTQISSPRRSKRPSKRRW